MLPSNGLLSCCTTVHAYHHDRTTLYRALRDSWPSHAYRTEQRCYCRIRTRNSDTAIPTVPTVDAFSFRKAVVTFRQPDVYICRLAWKFLSHGCLCKHKSVFEKAFACTYVSRSAVVTDFHVSTMRTARAAKDNETISEV